MHVFEDEKKAATIFVVNCLLCITMERERKKGLIAIDNNLTSKYAVYC